MSRFRSLICSARSNSTGKSTASRTPQRRAFSLAELLVVIAGLGVLATLTLVAATHPKDLGALVTCRYNLRQLGSAWVLYAHDNQGWLPANSDGGYPVSGKNWCGGWLDFSGRSDNTNVLFFQNGQLGKYVGDKPSLIKCPADLSAVIISNKSCPRVRSVSMQTYMGLNYNRLTGPGASSPYTSGYRQFTKLADIVIPSPTQAAVFLDEREDSINDGCLEIDMTGFDPAQPTLEILVDFPADYHDRGANFSFADGHVETWRWRDPRTTPLHRFGALLALGISTPNNPDVARIQAAASRKIGGTR